ncbi:MAG: LPS assembly protein LptD, partial [Gallionellaceae bacterium]|nr:LPS assembly protein LptD [Gallionellaceae bacterium]
MRFCFVLAAFSMLCTFSSAWAEDEGLTLKLDRTFMARSPNQDEIPVFISAQHLQGQQESQIEASGQVELRHGNQSVFADEMRYQQTTQELIANGAVRLEQADTVIYGPYLKLDMGTDIGDMPQPVFLLTNSNARGSADNLHIQGKQNYILDNAVYTTCEAGNDDWLLKMGVLEIDRNRQVGTAHNARVEFMGVPILYTPWMDFSLNSQRKSGFLGPTFGSTGNNGFDLTLPYFWNIAPNRDATIAPRLMSKRGLMINNEFRYLEPTYTGEAHLDTLSNDRIVGGSRSRFALKHGQSLAQNVGGAITYNRVSDDAYFRDLSDAVNATSQTNLVREGMLAYNHSNWNAALRLQRFQTLQDPAAPVAIPYRRMPQLSLNAQQSVAQSTATFTGELVDFRHPSAINGKRLVAYPSISYPLLTQSAVYVTPKLGLHNTYYALGENNVAGLPDKGRSVPIFSLDNGLVLERDLRLGEQGYIQTLEPRAYYVYIPYRNQDALPNFDSAQADFNFAQMFTENRFFGNDRIGDANQITLALTSRLLAQESGAERLRVAAGERFSLATPQVNLVAPTATTNKSDILLA